MHRSLAPQSNRPVPNIPAHRPCGVTVENAGQDAVGIPISAAFKHQVIYTQAESSGYSGYPGRLRPLAPRPTTPVNGRRAPSHEGLVLLESHCLTVAPRGRNRAGYMESGNQRVRPVD